MRGGEKAAHRAAFGHAQQHGASRAHRIQHGPHIVHALFERRQIRHAIGQASAALVEEDQPPTRGVCGRPTTRWEAARSTCSS
jgi:hypothetical protein